VRHFASPDFWDTYNSLPPSIQNLADKNFALLKTNPLHPSLRFKRVGDFCSVRVGIGYRALGKNREEGIVWFWIGSHADYDQLLRQ
jgi:hypothetical protein